MDEMFVLIEKGIGCPFFVWLNRTTGVLREAVKFQSAKFKTNGLVWSLDIGVWNLFGIWDLIFGICRRR